MFIGHFGIGLALKRADETLSLGLLFIAVQLSDLIYGVALLTGIEKVSIIEGTNPLTSAQYIFFPYSHSLVATLVLAGLVALIFLMFPFKSSLPKSRTALVMATAVMSHFVLDVIVHNPDIDLLGNGVYKIGLGLWNYPIASYIVEALLLITGLWIYLKSTKGKDFSGKYGLPILSIILLTLNGVNTFMLYPTNVENFAVTMLAVYLATIIIAFWLDRKRTAK
jgi:membrane-bound metal-dependent hydrolase YbcI (DUF457 family)